MPELPDIALYVEALTSHVMGRTLERVHVASPFLIRSVTTPIDNLVGRRVVAVHRIGKRLVIGFDGDVHVVLHLMIAGRLRWKPPGTATPKRNGLATFDFGHGTLLLTEASKKKRASLHVVTGTDQLGAFDRGGIDVLTCPLDDFAERLRSENHTLKRALTDPRLFDGIGNAYSDEILHAARLSPLTWTSRLDPDDITRLYRAARATLRLWIDRLREETGDRFPDKVTAFRAQMAVHGKYGMPCPDCGAPVQRIRYAENEVNYCASCQTGGRVLADRALSRLLREDWPRSIEEWEARLGTVP